MFRRPIRHCLALIFLLSVACDSRQWQRQVPGQIVGEAVAFDDQIFLLVERYGVDFAALSIDAKSGNLRWIQPALGWEACEELVGDARQLLIRCGPLMTALDPADGRVLWRLELPAKIIEALQFNPDIVAARIAMPPGRDGQARLVGPGHGVAVEHQSTLDLQRPLGEGVRPEAKVWRWMAGYPPAYAWLWMAMDELEGPAEEPTPTGVDEWDEVDGHYRAVQQLTFPWELESNRFDSDYSNNSDELWIMESLTAQKLARHAWYEVEGETEGDDTAPEVADLPTPTPTRIHHPYEAGRHVVIVVDRATGQPIFHLRGYERGKYQLHQDHLLWVAPERLTATDWQNGRRAWDWNTGVEPGFEGQITLKAKGNALVVATERAIQVLHPSSGALKWRRPTEGRVDPLISEKELIMMSGGSVRAFDLRFGDPLWQIGAVGVVRQPFLTQRDLLTLSLSGDLRVYDLENGELRRELTGLDATVLQFDGGLLAWREGKNIHYREALFSEKAEQFEIPVSPLDGLNGETLRVQIDLKTLPGMILLKMDEDRLVLKEL